MKKFVLLALIFLAVGVFISAGTSAYAQFAQSPPLDKFIQPLRGLGGATGIPVSAPDAVQRPWWQPGVTHYTIDINQFTDTLHPSLGPTTLWGYGGPATGNVNRHLGGIIVAERDKPVQITFRNRLTSNGTPNGIPLSHIIPLDQTIPGANQDQNRTATHLHGGFVPWISDGGPFDWWAPNGNHGPSFFNNMILHKNAAPNEAEYYYPNDQSARLMWYHDHAYGITRINAYAGIASAYVITDSYEKLLTEFPYYIPGPLDPRTIYLVFQDKIFVDGQKYLDKHHKIHNPNYITNMDPTWPGSKLTGSLWYAHVYDPNRWTLGPGLAPPDPSVIPEFFGDTILVNGSVYPTVTLEKREYRFRMLNACNARFLNFKLVKADSTGTEPEGGYTSPTLATGFAQTQIGTEGGFLPYPTTPQTTFYTYDPTGILIGTSSQPYLTLAPAERTDLIFDFRNVPPGTYLLYNDSPAPYPAGDDINDYYPGNLLNPTPSTPGKGPNTRTLLQIVVNPRTGPADKKIDLPPVFAPTDPFLVFQKPGMPSPLPARSAESMEIAVFPFFKVKAKVRHLTLNEDFDKYGRLIQYLGTNSPNGSGTFGLEYMAPPTEVVNKGAYEVWEIANLTGDTHPIHFHLVDVQVLGRRNFDAINYMGTPEFTAKAIAPDSNELGWKETVRMNPGQVTWVLMKFDLPKVPFTVPSSQRIEDYGIVPKHRKAHEYVWHCHILEHEEHDMMRPLVVIE